MRLLTTILGPFVALVSEQRHLGIFMLVTILLGGGAAWLTGRAIAAAWRPWWHVLGFMLLIAAAVRFLHMSLFGGTLISPYFYVVDTAFCMAFGLLGFRLMRVSQMVASYGWINERAGLLSWRRRPDVTGTPGP
jgi:Domain of unknown function (DUF6867)